MDMSLLLRGLLLFLMTVLPHSSVYAFSVSSGSTIHQRIISSGAATSLSKHSFGKVQREERQERQKRRRGMVTALTGSVAESVAGGLFPLSLPPYLTFLYFASYRGRDTLLNMPPLALAGFRFLLVFVGMSIPAAIIAGVAFDVSLADCDWLHGSAESLLVVTNLLVVLGFRRALGEKVLGDKKSFVAEGSDVTNTNGGNARMSSYPSIFSEGDEKLPLFSVLRKNSIIPACGFAAVFLSGYAAAAAAVSLGSLDVAEVSLSLPSVLLSSSSSSLSTTATLGSGLSVHSGFLGAVGDLPAFLAPSALFKASAVPEPLNALTVATWIIHISSLIEWLVAMGLIWKYADATSRVSGAIAGCDDMKASITYERWRGVTWGMLPLHSSGICACVYHLFYNHPNVEFLVALQAFLTTFGNCTLGFAAYRLAVANGWNGREQLPSWVLEALCDSCPDTKKELPFQETADSEALFWENWTENILRELPKPAKAALAKALLLSPNSEAQISAITSSTSPSASKSTLPAYPSSASSSSSSLLTGFEDLGEQLAQDGDLGFIGKLFGLSAGAAYIVKYGELFFPNPFVIDSYDGTAAASWALALIGVPTALNMAKWASRSTDPKSTAFDLF